MAEKCASCYASTERERWILTYSGPRKAKGSGKMAILKEVSPLTELLHPQSVTAHRLLFSSLHTKELLGLPILRPGLFPVACPSASSSPFPLILVLPPLTSPQHREDRA